MKLMYFLFAEAFAFKKKIVFEQPGKSDWQTHKYEYVSIRAVTKGKF